MLLFVLWGSTRFTQTLTYMIINNCFGFNIKMYLKKSLYRFSGWFWQWRYCQHPKCIHNVCLKHPSMSYPLYFINCNKLDSEISRRDWHRNVIFGICWDSHDFDFRNEPYGRVFSFFLSFFFVFALAFIIVCFVRINAFHANIDVYDNKQLFWF
jgi:hypothetical protein